MSEPTLKTYLAIYKGRKAYIEAESSIQARYKAIELIKPSKAYMLKVIPAEQERKS